MKPRSDAYVGLLGLSLLALSAAILFAFLNWDTIKEKPKPVQMAPMGGGGAAPRPPAPGGPVNTPQPNAPGANPQANPNPQGNVQPGNPPPPPPAPPGKQ